MKHIQESKSAKKTCNKCRNPVEYRIPESLCGEHWIKWLANGNKELEEEATKIVKRAREKR